MINWWLVAPMLTFFIFAIIGNAGWYVDSKDLKKTRIAYWKHRDANILLEEKYATIEKERDDLNRENESLHTANKRIVTEQIELHKQNTKLREDLQEAKAKIKALDMQTVEIEEVKPAKRTSRKKATQN